LNPLLHARSTAPDMLRSNHPLIPRNEADPSSSGIRANSDLDNEINRTFSTALSDDNLTLLCCEERVKFLHFLLSKADKLDEPKKSNICNWTFCDLTQLFKSEQTE
jgi:hypothetical protein